MPKEKTIRLDGRDIPCKDVLSIHPVIVSDGDFSEFTYRLVKPHMTKVRCFLMPQHTALCVDGSA